MLFSVEDLVKICLEEKLRKVVELIDMKKEVK
jgi:hypothetical protein